MQWWLGKTTIITPNLSPFFFPQLLSAEHNTIWCSQFLLTGGVRSRKCLDYCWTGLTQLNHPWIINTASRTNPKYSPYQWLWRKLTTQWKAVHWAIFRGALQTDQLGGISLYSEAIFPLLIQEFYAELLGASLLVCILSLRNWFISNFQTCYNQLLTSLLPWMRSLTCHLQMMMMFNVCSEVSFRSNVI